MWLKLNFNKNKKIRVLFICKGNIYRSMSAEYCLKKYIEDKGVKGIIVRSAGTEAKKQKAHPETRRMLKKFGISIKKHKQRRVTKTILKNQDLTICMAKDHQKYLKDKFNIKAPLFENITEHKHEDITDIDQKVHDLHTTREVINHIRKTIKDIHRMTPRVLDYINKQLKN